MQRHRNCWVKVFVRLALASTVLIVPVAVPAANTEPTQAGQQIARPQVDWPVFPTALQKKINKALAGQAQQNGQSTPDYQTRWLNADGLPIFTNRLILSDSPYLLEHAHNPINWYAYGPEALAAAKAQNKPLFISIGYASCHWCHVMARESFESPAVARELNRNFIAVKVDRQQQPALDHRYQIAVALVNQGQSGWPASVFALPDGRPFFTQLYQPEPSFLATLNNVHHVWQTKRPEVTNDALKLTALMRQVLDQQAKAAKLDDSVLAKTVNTLTAQFDPFQGGFGDGAKFPQATRLLFLLDWLARDQAHLSHPNAAGSVSTAQTKALQSELVLTLNHMARGGLFDQIGGGFFRYSTTPDWQVPHFEKMAYDQAMLAQTYLKAGLVLGNARDWRVAERTLDFVIRDMSAADGGFIAALSADSAVHHQAGATKEEGYFYTWTPKEIAAVLPPDEARLAERYWSITASGTVDGRSVPHQGDAAVQAALAKTEGMSLSALTAKMAAIRAKLESARQQRPAPARDENRILGWNGLMIEALGDGGRVLGAPRFIAAAQKAAEFIDTNMRLPDGTLAHSYNRGVASGRANLADHADFALGLVALYDATGKKHWLRAAEKQAQIIAQDFAAANGGYFDHKALHTKADGDVLNLPSRPIDDGAEPAGNAQALALQLALAARTDDAAYQEAAELMLASFSGLIVRDPTDFTGLLAGLSDLRHGSVGSLTFAGKGNVRIEAARTTKHTAEVRLHFTAPWHSNAHNASPGLIPTAIKVSPDAFVRQIDYPQGKKVKLAFSDQPLNLYTGTQVLNMKLNPHVSGPIRITVQIQACSDAICLAPEDLAIWLPL
jgi:uncharacterized protein YyaL (SSP411 family)